MKIGVYVGSFNPFHKGHHQVITFLLKKKVVDKIIVIPTGKYWDKDDLIKIDDRIKMLKYIECKEVIIEKKLNKLPYTYQILDKLKEKYQSDELNLIIGSDNIVDFHKWKNTSSILENYVIVLKRDKIDIDKYIKKFKEYSHFKIIKGFKPVNICGSKIRKLIKNNRLLLTFKYLDDSIIRYICEKGLYGVKMQNDSILKIERNDLLAILNEYYVNEFGIVTYQEIYNNDHLLIPIIKLKRVLKVNNSESELYEIIDEDKLKEIFNDILYSWGFRVLDLDIVCDYTKSIVIRGVNLAITKLDIKTKGSLNLTNL